MSNIPDDPRHPSSPFYEPRGASNEAPVVIHPHDLGMLSHRQFMQNFKRRDYDEQGASLPDYYAEEVSARIKDALNTRDFEDALEVFSDSLATILETRKVEDGPFDGAFAELLTAFIDSRLHRHYKLEE